VRLENVTFSLVGLSLCRGHKCQSQHGWNVLWSNVDFNIAGMHCVQTLFSVLLECVMVVPKVGFPWMN
jgi:hypothetical protein